MYDEIFSQITNAANKRNLRDSTIHAYCTSVAHFLKYTDKPIDALTTDDVDTFLIKKRLSGISPETYNHYHSGIRFFYKKVLKMNWDDDDIPRMKRDRSLPIVLTKAEISAILDATPNLKHKAMIATMYSGGLRVSEVTHLHYDDISRTNKTIHIRDGKSRFDRYTLLADRTLEILTEYWFKCGRPTGILFPSSWSGDYLVKDSVIDASSFHIDLATLSRWLCKQYQRTQKSRLLLKSIRISGFVICLRHIQFSFSWSVHL